MKERKKIKIKCQLRRVSRKKRGKLGKWQGIYHLVGAHKAMFTERSRSKKMLFKSVDDTHVRCL